MPKRVPRKILDSERPKGIRTKSKTRTQKTRVVLSAPSLEVAKVELAKKPRRKPKVVVEPIEPEAVVEPEVVPDEEPEETEEEVLIRAKAKEMKIKSWWLKSVDNLITEIEELEEPKSEDEVVSDD